MSIVICTSRPAVVWTSPGRNLQSRSVHRLDICQGQEEPAGGVNKPILSSEPESHAHQDDGTRHCGSHNRRRACGRLLKLDLLERTIVLFDHCLAHLRTAFGSVVRELNRVNESILDAAGCAAFDGHAQPPSSVKLRMTPFTKLTPDEPGAAEAEE